tara:strand:- start:275 stop:979 length:705 start_codon:yes stop_codon:yes gene_type:complete
MNRFLTNKIRYFLDELIPPFIRDNKFFMYPFFFYWFKGKNISLMMNFKTEILKISDSELSNIYSNLDSRSRDRDTDLNSKTIKKIISIINPKSKTLIDVGCGNGFLIEKIKLPLSKFGCDVFDEKKFKTNQSFNYSTQNIKSMKFKDNYFDTVICCHTIEHIPDINTAINELKRIAKKEIIIVVPKQKFYFYTLDLHLHFFPDKFSIINLIRLKNYILYEIDGDWLYIGYLDKS